jgi:hypothetical protein
MLPSSALFTVDPLPLIYDKATGQCLTMIKTHWLISTGIYLLRKIFYGTGPRRMCKTADKNGRMS